MKAGSYWMLASLVALSAACAEDGAAGTSATAGDDASATADSAAPGEDAAATGDDTAAPTGDVASPGEDTSGPEPSTDRVDLGTVPAGDTGVTEEIELVVPEGVTSFAITGSGPSGVYVALDRLRAPNGEVLVTTNWYQSPFNQGGPSLCLNCLVRVSSQEAAHAALIPNSPDIAVTPGTYRFAFATFALVSTGPFSNPTIQPKAADVDIQVTFQRRPDPEAGGVLDLNLHFTGAGGLTAANAPEDPRIIDALDVFETTYAAVGVSLGEVRYFDIDAGLQAVEGMQGAGNDFEVLARETANAPEGVNVVFVREITEPSSPLGGFGVILGVAGGIPGPVGVQGTGRSAVVVSVTDPPPGAGGVSGFGHTMAHEVGHYLGLFHSSELPLVPLHDPLPDTPENDQTNLMFYSGSGNKLSPHQGQVIKNNPWVRPSTEN